MDPLSAISLAGNVIQFVTFTSSLISTTKEIHHSSRGCTGEALRLEEVYEQLREFSDDLIISSQAHRDTSADIAKTSDPESPITPTNLKKWLNEEDGIFWVSGKPGSGKSTFMRYLAESSRTKELLSNWSRPQPAIIACHYFWSPGTQMQKSYKGLLQTLLYDIFRQCPNLIESCHQRQLPTDSHELREPWSIAELQQMLQGVANAHDIGVKFCMFIDGLDEYEGDHLELCSALNELTKSTHIKLCISSRPWNVFTDAFGQDHRRMLYIHDITKKDIQRYTADRLLIDPRWKDLLVDTPSANLLIREIVQRASGVFLWVALVTKLLRDGLNECDCYSDLHKRLHSLPYDLDSLFQYIVDNVEVSRWKEMASSLSPGLEIYVPRSRTRRP